MKKVFLFVILLLLCGASFAATVVLRDGTIVEGTIIERTANSLKLDLNGFTITYYNDEIDRVDEAGDTSSAGNIPEGSAVAVESPVPAAEVSPGRAASDLTKDELVVKFMDVFGTGATMRGNFDQMASAMPSDLAAKFKAAINVDDIIKKLVPLYARYFSEEELQAYVDFYSSAAGQKLVKAIPNIMKDSIAVSEKYFEDHLPAEFKEPPPASSVK